MRFDADGVIRALLLVSGMAAAGFTSTQFVTPRADFDPASDTTIRSYEAGRASHATLVCLQRELEIARAIALELGGRGGSASSHSAIYVRDVVDACEEVVRWCQDPGAGDDTGRWLVARLVAARSEFAAGTPSFAEWHSVTVAAEPPGRSVAVPRRFMGEYSGSPIDFDADDVVASAEVSAALAD